MPESVGSLHDILAAIKEHKMMLSRRSTLKTSDWILCSLVCLAGVAVTALVLILFI